MPQRWHNELLTDRCSMATIIFVRAGYATTLPQQCDHVFRPQACWLLHLLWLLHFVTLTFLEFFRVIDVLIHCRVIVVAKLKHCRLPSSDLCPLYLGSTRILLLFSLLVIWGYMKSQLLNLLGLTTACDWQCSKQLLSRSRFLVGRSREPEPPWIF